ncbi:hypothetical protein CPLU01_00581 [Colletotrichum plurivorum]|uniref:Uncharacterized protein n=1 Tax=Colletotrichum plurivorum TaxID=2175906 RepID=A0A8H6NRV9_9PEZI|nr:hypothetical protein CPLU01_00581 [Colletotrichum plurivorum]
MTGLAFGRNTGSGSEVPSSSFMMLVPGVSQSWVRSLPVLVFELRSDLLHSQDRRLTVEASSSYDDENNPRWPRSPIQVDSPLPPQDQARQITAVRGGLGPGAVRPVRFGRRSGQAVRRGEPPANAPSGDAKRPDRHSLYEPVPEAPNPVDGLADSSGRPRERHVSDFKLVTPRFCDYEVTNTSRSFQLPVAALADGDGVWVETRLSDLAGNKSSRPRVLPVKSSAAPNSIHRSGAITLPLLLLESFRTCSLSRWKPITLVPA